MSTNWQFTPCLQNWGWGAEYYRQSQVSLLPGGYLRLTADKVSPFIITYGSNEHRKVSYKSGMIQTKCVSGVWPPPNGYKYGMFEVRCKLPSGEPTWPAFWLYSGPTEIDIFEAGNTTRESSNNVHDWTSGTLVGCQVINHKLNWDDLSQNYHTYSAVWTPNEVTFFFDGREIRTVSSSSIPTFPYEADIILNLGMVSWSNLSTATMDIDFVKVYQFKNNNYGLSYKSSNEFIHHDIYETAGSNIPLVNYKQQSITLNTNNANEVFFIGTDKRLYKSTRSSSGNWSTAKINYNYNVPLPAANVEADLAYHKQYNYVLYRGGDSRIQFFGKSGNQYWHWWIDDDWNNWSSIPGVSSTYGSIKVAPNGIIVYKGTDNKVHYYKNINGDWKHFTLNHPNNSSSRCKGDIVIASDNNIIYKGYDNRLQIFWINRDGNYQHAWIDDYWYTSSYTVNSKPGSIVYSDDGIYYNGTDNKIHRFYWSGDWYHQLLPYSYGTSSLGYINGDYVRGSLAYDKSTKSVLYIGYDGRVQFFRKNGSSYYHGWINDYWVTDEYDADNNTNTYKYSSTFATNDIVYYKRKDGHLSYFKYEPCEVLDPPCNSHINLRSTDIISDQDDLRRFDDLNVTLYPNPAQNFLNIEIKNGISIEDRIQYSIYSLEGQKLTSGYIDVTIQEVNISELPTGTYLVKLTNNSNSVNKIFIKQ